MTGPSPVGLAKLSAQLYAVGVDTGDPLLLISAARLRKTLAPAATDRAPDGATALDGAPLTWEEMLATAEALAADDAALLGLIADVRAETVKGVDGGVGGVGRVPAGRRVAEALERREVERCRAAYEVLDRLVAVEVVGAAHLGDEPRALTGGRTVVQAVDVAQQDECIGFNKHGNQCS